MGQEHAAKSIRFFNRRRSLCGYLAFASVVLLVIGCAATPREQYGRAEQTTGAAADAVKVAVDRKLITDRGMLTSLRAALIEADRQLATAHPLIKAGKFLDAKFYVDGALDAAERVLEYLAAQPAKQEARK